MFTSGCKDDPTRSRPPAAVALLSGNAQPGTAGAALPNSVVVRVTDADGDPVGGVQVTFQAISDGGSIQPATVRTDRTGVAAATWTLGAAAGPQTATARVEGLPPVTFTAQAGAAAVARLRLLPDSAFLPGLGTDASVSVAFVDQFGNVASIPAADAVAWTSLDPQVASAAPGGQPGEGRVTAQGTGRARLVATAGPLADTAVVGVAQVPTVIEVELQGGPAAFVARTKQALARVNDAGGSRIPNPPVTWESGDTTVLTVDANGVVAGVREGTAVVRARSGTVVGETSVVVLAVVLPAASVGGATSCVLSEDGQAYCWGANHTGQAGSWGANHDTPRPVATQLRFWAISTGAAESGSFAQYVRSHACAVATDATAWCWGQGRLGQLGTGSTPGDRCTITDSKLARQFEDDKVPCSYSPRRVLGSTWRTIAAGATHTCAISTAGQTYCWGSNSSGELGAASTGTCRALSWYEGEAPCALYPVLVAGVPAFTSVTAGNGYTCALTAAGAAWCWGRSTAPAPVAGGLAFTQIDAESSHTCGVTTSGAVYCWGYNASGQLGNGGTSTSSTPVQAGGGGTYVDVAVGVSHTCAVRSGGGAWCWGSNESLQLGISGVAQSSTPVAVSGGHAFTTIEAGGAHTCGRRAGDGVLLCWGDNRNGRLGTGEDVGGQTALPVRVPGA